MGWGYCGKDDLGRDIGYNVEAMCDYPLCDNNIDRGLGCVCGRMHGGAEHGCGRYFCGHHLLAVGVCLNCSINYPWDEQENE